MLQVIHLASQVRCDRLVGAGPAGCWVPLLVLGATQTMGCQQCQLLMCARYGVKTVVDTLSP